MTTASFADTPTERATSPRMMEAPVREWPVELQLPTGQIGPQEEPERFASRYIVTAHGLQQNMKNCCVKQHRDAVTMIGIERVVKQNYGRKKSMNEAFGNGKPRSRAKNLGTIPLFQLVRLQRKLRLCVFFPMFTTLSGRMILPGLQGQRQSSRNPLQQQADLCQQVSIVENLQGLVVTWYSPSAASTAAQA